MCGFIKITASEDKRFQSLKQKLIPAKIVSAIVIDCLGIYISAL